MSRSEHLLQQVINTQGHPARSWLGQVLLRTVRLDWVATGLPCRFSAPPGSVLAPVGAAWSSSATTRGEQTACGNRPAAHASGLKHLYTFFSAVAVGLAGALHGQQPCTSSPAFSCVTAHAPTPPIRWSTWTTSATASGYAAFPCVISACPPLVFRCTRCAPSPAP